VVRVAEPDRPARRWSFAAKAEQPPDGQARQFAAQVVESVVEGRSGCLRVRRLGQASEDHVERERVVAKRVATALEELDGARSVLVIALARRSLAVAGVPGVMELDDHRLALVGGLAGDDKRLGERVGLGSGLELHGGERSRAFPCKRWPRTYGVRARCCLRPSGLSQA